MNTALDEGVSLGAYRVVRRLGAGASGEVYEAFDTKLNRSVALKLVPNEETVLHEARAAAKLEHPNILTVHGVEVHGEHALLVTELVRGKTLRELLREGDGKRSPLDLAIQMARGLAAAHAAGVVHRDLKPENVMVTEEGTVKILDFGLARPVSPQASDDEAETVSVGYSGTVGYSAPEQVEGKSSDHRADVFSFGCVVYEMLSGRLPFEDTVALVRDEPKPVQAPAELQKLIARLLRKDPERRPQSLSDVGLLIEELAATPPSRTAWKIAAALLLVVIVWILWPLPPPSPPMEVTQLTSYPGSECCPSFAPDGSHIAFVWYSKGTSDIFLYPIRGGEPVQLTDTLARETAVSYSPNGARLAFVRDSETEPGRGDIISIAAFGGDERLHGTALVTAGSDHGLDWSPDGRTLALVDQETPEALPGIFLLSLDTKTKRRLTHPVAPDRIDRTPSFSPDGTQLAFVRRGRGGFNVFVMELPDGEPRQLTFGERVLDLDWSADGKNIIFSNFVRLFRVPASGGEPEPLEHESDAAWRLSVSPLSESRSIVYVEPRFDYNIWRGPGPTNPDGEHELLIQSTRDDGGPRYSPDGRWILFNSDRNGDSELYITDSEGENLRQLTFLGHGDFGRWSPDGKWVAFMSRTEDAPDIYIVSADGGEPRRLTDFPGVDSGPSFSRDGRYVYFGSNRGGQIDMWRMPVDGGEARQITHDGALEGFESFDGSAFYYVRAPFVGGGIWRTSPEGGPSEPVPGIERDITYKEWDLSREGVAVSRTVPGEGQVVDFFELQTSHVRRVAVIEPAGAGVGTGLSVSPDGRYILYTRNDATGDDLVLIENYR